MNQRRFARSYLRLRAPRPEGEGSVADSVVKDLGFREILNEARYNDAADHDRRRIARGLCRGF